MVQEGVALGVDEELRGRAVHDSGSSHGQRTDLIFEAVGRFVLDRSLGGFLLEILIKSAALNHEAGHHAVENRPIVEPGVYVFEKVGNRDRGFVSVELSLDCPLGGLDQDDGIRLLVRGGRLVRCRCDGRYAQQKRDCGEEGQACPKEISHGLGHTGSRECRQR